MLSHLGSIAGGSNGSAETMKHVPREKGCITATVRLPALLLIISYAATWFWPSRWTKDRFCRVNPATRVGSTPSTRNSVGHCKEAFNRMISELLLISGRGLKAKPLGDPDVYGPAWFSDYRIERARITYRFYVRCIVPEHMCRMLHWSSAPLVRESLHYCLRQA